MTYRFYTSSDPFIDECTFNCAQVKPWNASRLVYSSRLDVALDDEWWTQCKAGVTAAIYIIQMKQHVFSVFCDFIIASCFYNILCIFP